MNNEDNRAESQALAQVASITEMVAALECDYDRLEELREERAALVDEDAEALERGGNWGTQRAIAEWDELNSVELADLTEAAGEFDDREQAEQRISEDALSVEVRSGWESVGGSLTPSEFRILLCTGGPHVEIVGELDADAQPDRVRILYKDWGTSGELFDFDHDAVLTYCQQFYFGG